jgi:hypothetical protein
MLVHRLGKVYQPTKGNIVRATQLHQFLAHLHEQARACSLIHHVKSVLSSEVEERHCRSRVALARMGRQLNSSDAPPRHVVDL